MDRSFIARRKCSPLLSFLFPSFFFPWLATSRGRIVFKFPQYPPISILELSLLARFLFHLWPSSAGPEIYIRVPNCKKTSRKVGSRPANIVHSGLLSVLFHFCFCSPSSPSLIALVSFHFLRGTYT